MPRLVPVHFEFTHSTAISVAVAGTFNNWHPTTKSMQPSGNGHWRKDAFLPPGTYRPTDLAPNHTSAPCLFPAPAPAAPYATNLSAFNGASPNGTWSLYVADNSPGAAGTLNGGWSLTITTQSTRPILNQPTRTSTNATLSWSAVAGVSYRVQHKADFNSATWSELAGDVTAVGTNAVKVDATVSGTASRYYRIQVLP